MIRVPAGFRYIGTSAERTTNTGFENGDFFFEEDTEHTYYYFYDAWHIANRPNVRIFETFTDTNTMANATEVVELNKATTATLTLKAHLAGDEIRLINIGAGTWTITPTSGNINGSGTATLLSGERLIIMSNGTDWN